MLNQLCAGLHHEKASPWGTICIGFLALNPENNNFPPPFVTLTPESRPTVDLRNPIASGLSVRGR